jgi:hypothetical protein
VVSNRQHNITYPSLEKRNTLYFVTVSPHRTSQLLKRNSSQSSTFTTSVSRSTPRWFALPILGPWLLHFRSKRKVVPFSVVFCFLPSSEKGYISCASTVQSLVYSYRNMTSVLVAYLCCAITSEYCFIIFDTSELIFASLSRNLRVIGHDQVLS